MSKEHPREEPSIFDDESINRTVVYLALQANTHMCTAPPPLGTSNHGIMLVDYHVVFVREYGRTIPLFFFAIANHRAERRTGWKTTLQK